MKILRLAKLVAAAAGESFDKRKHKQVVLKELDGNLTMLVKGKYVVTA